MAENHEEALQRDDLLRRMNGNRLVALSNPFENKTIFRVPTFVHEAHKHLFEPKMVSIGPYHYHKSSLRSMDKHKWSFLRAFLQRNNVSLERYISAIRELELEARMCYSEDIDIQGDEFVMMLILDGFFILEHLLRLSNNQESNSAYCNTGWGFSALTTDLALLENQIPFFVLHKLYQIHFGIEPNGERTQICTENPCRLRVLFFNHTVCSSFIEQHTDTNLSQVECRHIKHYLDLIYKCMVSDDQVLEEFRLSRHREGESATTVIPCASMLDEEGVTFKRKINPRDMFDITFTDNGKMEIPHLSMNSDLKIIFSNIVAFEQTQVHVPPILMKYLSLMDALVNTKEDVNLLVKKGIFENMLPDEENAAAFFNDLGEFFVPVKCKRHQFSTEIQQYRANRWPTQRVQFMRDHGRNIWTIIALVAAVYLLVLSTLQTIFTIKQA